MNAKDAIKTALTGTQHSLSMYLSDLSDADLLVRPVPKANHIAWQLGHLISAEPYLIKQVLPSAQYPELPAGFDEQYTKETAAAETPKAVLTKQQYLDLFNKVRQATLAALAKVSDADLDKPTQGKMAPYAPNMAAMFLLVSNHTLMHSGQFTVVRRKLGKPVLF
jgi:uncharacterized damage-inducible protein DinB